MQNGYNSLKNAPKTELSCVSHYYRSSDGLLCISEEDSDQFGIHTLIPLISPYGFSDLSMLFQYALSQTVTVYGKHYTGQNKISADILIMIQDLISQYTYIDDLCILNAGWEVIKFTMNLQPHSVICNDT